MKIWKGRKEKIQIIVPLIIVLMLICVICVITIGIHITKNNENQQIAEIELGQEKISAATDVVATSVGTNVNATYTASNGEIKISSTNSNSPGTINKTELYSFFAKCGSTKNIKIITFVNTVKAPTDAARLFWYDGSNEKSYLSSVTTINNIGYLDVSQATSLYSMFGGMTNLISFSGSGLNTWIISQVTNMEFMFEKCINLTTVGDISSWDTSKVTDMECMFNNCINLTTVGDLSSWNVSGVTDMNYMFQGCKSLTSVGNLASWNVSSVTDMEFMFNNCINLTTVGDLSSWNVSNVIRMRAMFQYCGSLTSLGDLSAWNVSSVTDMSYMFFDCYNLTSVGNLAKWNVSSVTGMRSMFNKCNNLTTVGDLSSWNVSRVTDMGFMFNTCNNLTTVGDLSSWNVSNVISMRAMFQRCKNLTSIRGLSSWNVSSVTDISYMFYECSKLTTLNMNNWDISKVTDATDILFSCTSLKDIYTPKTYSTQTVSLPSSFYNVDNVNDNNTYSSFTKGTFAGSVHLGKLVDYNISYNLNNGSVSGENPITYNAISNFTLKNPTKNGYTFAGWTGSNGTTKQTSVTVNGRNVTGDLSYTANYTANTYTVTLNTNGGTISSGNVTGYTYGAGATLPTNITRAGYTFEGWYESNTFSGDAVTSISTTETGDKTYYAKWTINKYKVTVNPNGGIWRGVKTNTELTGYNYKQTVTIENPTRPGYEFTGWTATLGTISDTTYTFGLGNATLQAGWNLITPTVKNDIEITANKEPETTTVNETDNVGAGLASARRRRNNPNPRKRNNNIHNKQHKHNRKLHRKSKNRNSKQPTSKNKHRQIRTSRRKI